MGTILQGRIITPRASEIAAAIGDFLGAVLVRSADLLLLWQERATQRTNLAHLDAHLLRDMGLSRGDVLVEVEKPFWQS
jgi:uncharacterized protein YjiS (DUF1127 family)